MSIPNYRDAKCCFNCGHGKVERTRCGEYEIYCDHEEHFEVVNDTSVCDDYKDEVYR